MTLMPRETRIAPRLVPTDGGGMGIGIGRPIIAIIGGGVGGPLVAPRLIGVHLRTPRRLMRAIFVITPVLRLAVPAVSKAPPASATSNPVLNMVIATSSKR